MIIVNKMKRVFFIIGGGGHTAQMLLLQKDFDDNRFEKHFIVATSDMLSRKKLDKLGYTHIYTVDRFKLTEERLSYAVVRNFIFLQVFKQLWQSYKIIRLMKRDIVISAGPNTAMFVFIFARLRGNFCVFIESWSRRTGFSRSAKLLKSFSHIFLVQWEELAATDKKASYEGRLA